MFIKFKTVASGPAGKLWDAGEVREVAEVDGRKFVSDGVAEQCGTPGRRVHSLPDPTAVVDDLRKDLRDLPDLRAAVNALLEHARNGTPIPTNIGDPTSWRKSAGW